jgi:putative transposase
MARPLRIQYPGAYYHVTCRGNERKEIFLDNLDRMVFLEKLSASLETYNVELLVYVCMTNHFHLFVSTPRGNLAEFIRHLSICYTSAFNRRHKRVGHLFQGRYKSFLIDADNYLIEVSRYIHLNPVRIRLLAENPPEQKWDMLLKYQFSSLPGYFSAKKRIAFVRYESVLAYMGGDNAAGRQAYREFMKRGLERETESPLSLGKANGIVGARRFVDKVKSEILATKTSAREQPALRSLSKAIDPENLISRFAEQIGIDKAGICRRGKNSVERAMLMEFLYRSCNVTQLEIGRLVGGIDYSAVSQARKRLKEKLGRDRKLEKRFHELKRILTGETQFGSAGEKAKVLSLGEIAKDADKWGFTTDTARISSGLDPILFT